MISLPLGLRDRVANAAAVADAPARPPVGGWTGRTRIHAFNAGTKAPEARGWPQGMTQEVNDEGTRPEGTGTEPSLTQEGSTE